MGDSITNFVTRHGLTRLGKPYGDPEVTGAMGLTRPPVLSAGDTLALVAPSSPIRDLKLEIVRRRLRENFDLETEVYPSVGGDEPAPPADRATDLHDAFRDSGIDGVMAVNGGDDQIRVLPHLEPDVFCEHPKRFYGYSDNDNLRLFLWTLGIESYGIQVNADLVVDDDLHPYVERYLQRALFEDGLDTVTPADEWTQEWYDFETGTARDWQDNPGPTWVGDEPVSGTVWGGCTSILEWQLQSDRWLPSPSRLDGAVLALETSETLPRARRVGHLLRSLGQRGLLARFDGVIVGRPRSTSPTIDRDPAFEGYRRALREEITTQLDRFAPAVTAGFGFDFGHTEPTFPLPLGAEVTLRPSEDVLRFD